MEMLEEARHDVKDVPRETRFATLRQTLHARKKSLVAVCKELPEDLADDEEVLEEGDRDVAGRASAAAVKEVRRELRFRRGVPCGVRRGS